MAPCVCNRDTFERAARVRELDPIELRVQDRDVDQGSRRTVDAESHIALDALEPDVEEIDRAASNQERGA